MKGQFYYHDMAELTHLELSPDGRVVTYGRYYRFNQYLQTFPEMSVETNRVYFSRGKYKIFERNRIIIIVKGEFGKVIYQGTILDEDSMDLFWSYPFTKERKSGIFTRFSEENHIIHFQLSNFNIN